MKKLFLGLSVLFCSSVVFAESVERTCTSEPRPTDNYTFTINVYQTYIEVLQKSEKDTFNPLIFSITGSRFAFSARKDAPLFQCESKQPASRAGMSHVLTITIYDKMARVVASGRNARIPPVELSIVQK